MKLRNLIDNISKSLNLIIFAISPKVGLKMMVMDGGRSARKSYQFNKTMKENEAQLHIISRDLAYLEIGEFKFFFNTTLSKDGKIIKPVKRKVTNEGKKKFKSIIPYDGWDLFVPRIGHIGRRSSSKEKKG